ncbi:PKD domain-containing protein, partial [bacterium]|nr:PKD domain-containing protein [bacterium]
LTGGGPGLFGSSNWDFIPSPFGLGDGVSQGDHAETVGPEFDVAGGTPGLLDSTAQSFFFADANGGTGQDEVQVMNLLAFGAGLPVRAMDDNMGTLAGQGPTDGLVVECDGNADAIFDTAECGIAGPGVVRLDTDLLENLQVADGARLTARCEMPVVVSVGDDKGQGTATQTVVGDSASTLQSDSGSFVTTHGVQDSVETPLTAGAFVGASQVAVNSCLGMETNRWIQVMDSDPLSVPTYAKIASCDPDTFIVSLQSGFVLADDYLTTNSARVRGMQWVVWSIDASPATPQDIIGVGVVGTATEDTITLRSPLVNAVGDPGPLFKNGQGYRFLSCDLGGLAEDHSTPFTNWTIDCDTSDSALMTVVLAAPDLNNPPTITAGPTATPSSLVETTASDVSVQATDSDGPGYGTHTMEYVWDALRDYGGPPGPDAHVETTVSDGSGFGSAPVGSSTIPVGSCSGLFDGRPVWPHNPGESLVNNRTTVVSCTAGIPTGTLVVADPLDVSVDEILGGLVSTMDEGRFCEPGTGGAGNPVCVEIDFGGPTVFADISWEAGSLVPGTGSQAVTLSVSVLDDNCDLPDVDPHPGELACNTRTAPVTVSENIPPIADLAFTVIDPNPSAFQVQFDASGSFDTDTSPNATLVFDWDFAYEEPILLSDGNLNDPFVLVGDCSNVVGGERVEVDDNITTTPTVTTAISCAPAGQLNLNDPLLDNYTTVQGAKVSIFNTEQSTATPTLNHTYTTNLASYVAAVKVSDGLVEDDDISFVTVTANTAPEISLLWIYGVDTPPQGAFTALLDDETLIDPKNGGGTPLVDPATGGLVGFGVSICDDDSLSTLRWDFSYDGSAFFTDLSEDLTGATTVLPPNDPGNDCSDPTTMNKVQWEANSLTGTGVDGQGFVFPAAGQFRVAVKATDAEGTQGSPVCLDVEDPVSSNWTPVACVEGEPQSVLEVPLTVGTDQLISGNDPPATNASTNGPGQQILEVSSDGHHLFAVWSDDHECALGQSQIYFHHADIDFGFTGDVTWDPTPMNISHLSPCSSSATSPDLVIDPNDPLGDHLVVFYSDDNTGDQDIWWVESTDKGVTWGAPTTVPSAIHGSGPGVQDGPALSIEPAGTGLMFDGFWHVVFEESSGGLAKMYHAMCDVGPNGICDNGEWVEDNTFSTRLNNAPQAILTLDPAQPTSGSVNSDTFNLSCLGDTDFVGLGLLDSIDPDVPAGIPLTCAYDFNYETDLDGAGDPKESCLSGAFADGSGLGVVVAGPYSTPGLKRVGLRVTDVDGGVDCAVLWLAIDTDTNRPPVPAMRLLNATSQPGQSGRALGELDSLVGSMNVTAQCQWTVGFNTRGTWDPDGPGGGGGASNTVSCEWMVDWDENPANWLPTANGTSVGLTLNNPLGYNSGDYRPRIWMRACDTIEPANCSPVITSEFYLDDYGNDAPEAFIKLGYPDLGFGACTSTETAGVLDHSSYPATTPSFSICLDGRASFDREDGAGFNPAATAVWNCDADNLSADPDTTAPTLFTNSDGTAFCTYSSVGDWTVRLSLTDNQGEVGTKDITISLGYADDAAIDPGYDHDPLAGNQAPEAAFTLGPIVPEYVDNLIWEATLSLDCRSSVDPDGHVQRDLTQSCEWDLTGTWDGVPANFTLTDQDDDDGLADGLLSAIVGDTFGLPVSSGGVSGACNAAGTDLNCYREGVVGLRVFDNLGVKGYHQITVRVLPPENEPPQAAIQATPFVGDFPSGTTVAFTAVAVDSDDVTLADPTDCDGCTYAWDFDADAFGGATPATSTGISPPAVTYSDEHDYTVELTVTDAEGASKVVTTTIYVGDCPNDGTPCDDLSRNRGPIAFFVLASGTEDLGDIPPSGIFGVDFDGSRSHDLDGVITTYTPACTGGTLTNWTGSSDATWTCEYTLPAVLPTGYTVDLTVEDDGGPGGTLLSHTSSLDVYVSEHNQRPQGVLRITGPYVNHPSGQPISWVASDSRDLDGELLVNNGISQFEIDCDWDIGLPSYAVSSSSDFCAAPPDGPNLIAIRVEDDDQGNPQANPNGAEAQDVRVVVVWVNDPGQPQRPVAIASYNSGDAIGSGFHAVEIDLSDSFDPDGSALEYAIDCGNGQTNAGNHLTPTFTCQFADPYPAGPDTFTVTYEVCDLSDGDGFTFGSSGSCVADQNLLIRDGAFGNDWVDVADGVCVGGYVPGTAVRVTDNGGGTTDTFSTVTLCDATDIIDPISSDATAADTFVDIGVGQCAAEAYQAGNPVRIEDDAMTIGATTTTVASCITGGGALGDDRLNINLGLADDYETIDNARVVSLLDRIFIDNLSPLADNYLTALQARIAIDTKSSFAVSGTAGDTSVQLIGGGCANLGISRGDQVRLFEVSGSAKVTVATVDDCVGDLLSFPEPLLEDLLVANGATAQENAILDTEYVAFEVWQNRAPIAVATENGSDWVLPVGSTSNWHSPSEPAVGYLAWDPDGDTISYQWWCDGALAGTLSTESCSHNDVGRPGVTLQVSDAGNNNATTLNVVDTHNIARITNTPPMPVVYIDPQTDFIQVVDSSASQRNILLVADLSVDLESELNSSQFTFDCGDTWNTYTDPPFSPFAFQEDRCQYPANQTPGIPYSVAPINLRIDDPHVQPGSCELGCAAGETEFNQVPVRNMVNRAPHAVASGPDDTDPDTEDHILWVSILDPSTDDFVVSFSSHNSSDPEGQSLSFNWDCGGGTGGGAGPTTTCTYNGIGDGLDIVGGFPQFTVSLTATDTFGLQDTHSVNVRVVRQLPPQIGIYPSSAVDQQLDWDSGTLRTPDATLLDVIADGVYLFDQGDGGFQPFPGECPAGILPNCDPDSGAFSSLIHLDASRSHDPYGRNLFVEVDCDYDGVNFASDFSGDTQDGANPAFWEHQCLNEVSGVGLWLNTPPLNDGDWRIKRRVAIRGCQTDIGVGCPAGLPVSDAYDMTVWRNRIPLAHLGIQSGNVFSNAVHTFTLMNAGSWDPDGDPIRFSEGVALPSADPPDPTEQFEDFQPQWSCNDTGGWPYDQPFNGTNDKIVWDNVEGYRLAKPGQPGGPSRGDDHTDYCWSDDVGCTYPQPGMPDSNADRLTCTVTVPGSALRPSLYLFDNDPSDEGFSLESCLEFATYSSDPVSIRTMDQVCANDNSPTLGGAGAPLTVNNPPQVQITQTTGDLFGITPMTVGFTPSFYDPDGDPLSDQGSFGSTTGYEWDGMYSRSNYWGGSDDVSGGDGDLNRHDFSTNAFTMDSYQIDGAGIWRFGLRAITTGNHNAMIQSAAGSSSCFDEDLGISYSCDLGPVDIGILNYPIFASGDCKAASPQQDGDEAVFLVDDADAAFYSLGETAQIFDINSGQVYLSGQICDIVDIRSNLPNGDKSRIYLHYSFLGSPPPAGTTYIRHATGTLKTQEGMKMFVVGTDGYVGNIETTAVATHGGQIHSSGGSPGANLFGWGPDNHPLISTYPLPTLLDSDDRNANVTVSGGTDGALAGSGTWMTTFDSLPPGNPVHRIYHSRMVHVPDAVNGGWFDLNFEDQPQSEANNTVHSFGFSTTAGDGACNTGSSTLCRSSTTLGAGIRPSLADESQSVGAPGTSLHIGFFNSDNVYNKTSIDLGRSWRTTVQVNNILNTVSSIYPSVALRLDKFDAALLALVWTDFRDGAERIYYGCTEDLPPLGFNDPVWQLTDVPLGDFVASPTKQHSPAVAFYGDEIYSFWTDNRRGNVSDEVFFQRDTCIIN